MKAFLGCGRRRSLKRNGIYNNVLFVRWMINVQTFDIYHILTFCMSNFLQYTHKIFIEYYCKFLLYLNKYLLAIFLCYVLVGIYYLHSFHIWMYSDEYEIQEIELSQGLENTFYWDFMNIEKKSIKKIAHCYAIFLCSLGN